MGRSPVLHAQSSLLALVGLAVVGGAFAAFELATRSGSQQRAPVSERTASRTVAPSAPRFAPLPVPAASASAPLLPPAVARSLDAHGVVVVSLLIPGSELDSVAAREASAGAARAGAGWVSLDVLDDRQAAPLLRRFGVVQDPGVLVFRRPGELVARIDGFADRDVVAQAATDAA